MKRVAYSKQAESYLKRVQHRRRKAIVEKIEAYARGESVDAKPLKGGTWYGSVSVGIVQSSIL